MTSAAPAARPRFRTDLVAEPIDDDGQRYIDVIDPDTGNAFRFYEVEYSIACAMDGERDLSSLAAWAKEELGIAPSTDELATVISTLGELGYLEAADSAAAAASFADELLARGVVAPKPAPEVVERAPDVELGAGGLTAGWNVPATAAFAAAQPPAEVEDVELGYSGPPAQPVQAALDSMDLDLGASGRADLSGDMPPATAPPYELAPTLRPSTKPDSDDDGPTNLPRPAQGDFDDDEVSVDLSEHLAIRPQDVKEAVRASQVMKAVDVPPELLAQLDEREAQIAAAAEAAKQAARDAQVAAVPTKTPVAIDIPPAPVELPPPAMAKPEPVKAPVELPREPVAVGKPKVKSEPAPIAKPEPKAATPVEAPRKGTSPVLVALLVLVIVGAAAFAVWKFVIDKPGAGPGTASGETGSGSAGAGSSAAGTGSAASGTGSAATGSAATGSAATGSAGSGSAGTGSAGTAAPVGVTLHTAAGTSADIKAPAAGVVAVAPAVGAPVKAGDVIVRLAAPARIEAKVAELDYDIGKRVPAEIKRYQDQAAAARTAGNEAGAKGFDAKAEERSKRLAEKQAERAKYDAELAALIVKAETTGTVKKTTAKGAQVAAGAIIATVEQAPTLIGELTVAGVAPAVGATVKVASKAAADQQAECTVTAVDGAKATIACPADSGWADGTDVQIVP